MSINQNISYYRKLCGYTQEQLAEKLGVTGQSVSKWENGLSNPDISVLPDLAKALGVDINALFSETPNQNNGIGISELSELCYDSLLTLFAKAHHKFYHGDRSILTDDQLNKYVKSLKNDFDFPLPKCAYVIDEGNPEHSAVFLSDAFSFVDRSYGGADSALLFDLDKSGELLSVLGDKNARKILKALYEKLISEGEDGATFSPKTLSEATSLPEEVIAEAAKKLRHVGLIDEVEKIRQDGLKKEYCNLYSKNYIFVLAILRLAYIHASDMMYITLMYRDAKNCRNYEGKPI